MGKILQVLWRIWFALLAAILTVTLAPFLLLFSTSVKLYPIFYRFGRVWGIVLTYGMGFFPKVKREFEGRLPYPHIMSANHTSYLDIFLAYRLFKRPLVFLGKKELSKIPLFGPLYAKVSVLVDRTSQESRKRVVNDSIERINNGQGMVIFPEGGIPKVPTLLSKFKRGAFKIAAETGVPIIPVTFADHKRKFPAYKMAGSMGRLRITIHKPEYAKGKTDADVDELQNRVFNIIQEELKYYESNR